MESDHYNQWYYHWPTFYTILFSRLIFSYARRFFTKKVMFAIIFVYEKKFLSAMSFQSIWFTNCSILTINLVEHQICLAIQTIFKQRKKLVDFQLRSIVNTSVADHARVVICGTNWLFGKFKCSQIQAKLRTIMQTHDILFALQWIFHYATWCVWRNKFSNWMERPRRENFFN